MRWFISKHTVVKNHDDHKIFAWNWNSTAAMAELTVRRWNINTLWIGAHLPKSLAWGKPNNPSWLCQRDYNEWHRNSSKNRNYQPGQFHIFIERQKTQATCLLLCYFDFLQNQGNYKCLGKYKEQNSKLSSVDVIMHNRGGQKVDCRVSVGPSHLIFHWIDKIHKQNIFQSIFQ